ncbi:hypothetical protein [Hymenobacter jejuensis]|uniref:DUF5681 domain-containing protein n=1 Tax=Hymenobacter jejuensis TaxID=2502781 RepID=A0A5B8A1G9_9BACT|nr:hypothetical protein [Hymenobacter jejuensis]QDA60002.1 hypothetical protein FHG12_07705 [Hymenobacter jejuensis]
MPFKPGISGNPLGRPQGAANVATAQVREVLNDVLANISAEEILANLRGLQGKEFLDAYTKLAEFLTPKLQRVAQNEEFNGLYDVVVTIGGRDDVTIEE